jgi:two-component system, chemotaxis family, protein-glutamate methylesterase/glutaminase
LQLREILDSQLLQTEERQLVRRDIIVIGASAGGVEALQELVASLPAEFRGSVFIVLHILQGTESFLPEILQRRTSLKVHHPKDREKIKPGNIYVAPSDYHMILELGEVRLVRGPKENNHLPAIDPLFRTAATVYGPRVIGVVLTGNLDDGTAGLISIKSQGGSAIVQDPSDALFPDMPRNAMNYVNVDFTLKISEIGPALVSLNAEVLGKKKKTGEIDMEKKSYNTPFTCPDCHGVLAEFVHGDLLQYRCQVGHKFSPETLLKEQATELESTLWAAYRALHEDAKLSERLADAARKRRDHRMARRLKTRGNQLRNHSKVLERILDVKMPDNGK